MLVSAEGFFLLNFTVDFLILTLAQRGTWFINVRRNALASALGAGYAMADAALNLPWFSDAAGLTISLFIAFPVRSIRKCASAMFAAANVTIVLGTVVKAFSMRSGLLDWALPMGLSAGAIIATLMRRHLTEFLLEIPVRAMVQGKTSVFQALVDTGNLVTEPLSGLPVMIVSESVLGVYPQTERRVSYGAVGSNGELPCIKPEKLELHDGRKWVRAPDMWLGVYPGRMNGGVRALAPGVVLDGLTRR